ncbi:zinc-dependent peptidase [Clostridium sp. JS66]|uniref:zinc-dependent peptidase n=1 Tax=Clostridium sp. JS66 TaxID=3064705 RepID=UPI00298E1DEA|nr:zinc-dependent peptidase [Clostridium sp. JS66]WPC42969.1 zinc-dependent peptidase [Clostridium sp. JS66]
MAQILSSVANYVLNFDELASKLIDYLKNGIAVNLGGITVDTSTMEQLLNEIKGEIQGIDYKDLISALNLLGAKLDAFGANLGVIGTEKILGDAIDIGAIAEVTSEFPLETEGFLTGITFFQTNSTKIYGLKDNFDLYIEDGQTETQIFKNVFAKGFGEHKYLNVYQKISKSAIVKIVYHNNSLNNKVLWLDFHVLDVPAINAGSGSTIGGGTGSSITLTTTGTTAKYLRRFVVTDTIDSSYIDPTKIDTTYWTMAAERIPNDFWEGRNTLLQDLQASSSDGSTYKNSVITTITNYHKYLYQLQKDIRDNGLVLSDWTTDYTTFISNCNKDVSSGGYGLQALTRVEQTQIYLTYTFQTITLIFPSCASLFTADYINQFKTYLPVSRLRVLEWIDFSDVNPDKSVGAFNLDLGNNGDFKTFRTYMNVEPSALDPTTFTPSEDEVLNPFFFRLYSDGQTVTGDSVIGVDGFFPGLKWETKKVDSSYCTGDSKTMAVRVFLHELGHGIDFQYGTLNGTNLSDMAEWRNIGGWESGDPKTISKLRPTKWASECSESDKEPPISLYGCTLVYEDFAETHSCYCVNPNYLKTFFPKRYEFMEKYVKGFKPYTT